MLGAYYETRTITPIGIGAVDPTMASVATEAIESILAAVNPFVVVVPWATEDQGKWVPVLVPEQRFALYPVDAKLIDSIQRAAFGQPVGWIAIWDTVMRAEPEKLFADTPWEFFHSQAVYSERDTAEPPSIRFMYWGRLRDEVATKGTAATLEARVKAANATLVYAAALPIAGVGRSVPTTPFAQALAAQTQTSPAILPAALPAAPGIPQPSSPPALSPSSMPAVSSPSGWGGGLLLISVAGVAGYVAYRVARGR